MQPFQIVSIIFCLFLAGGANGIARELTDRGANGTQAMVSSDSVLCPEILDIPEIPRIPKFPIDHWQKGASTGNSLVQDILK